MALNQFGVTWIYFGVFASLLFTMQELVSRRRANWNIIILILVVSSYIMRLPVILQGTVQDNPLLLFGFPTLMLLTGPLMLRVAYGLLDIPYPSPLVFSLHLLPAILCFAGEVMLFVVNPGIAADILRRYYTGQPIEYGNLAILSVGLSLVFYSLFVLYRFIRIARSLGLPYGNTVVMGAVIPVLGVVGTVGYALRSFEMLKIVAYLHTLGIVTAILFQSRYPDFFTHLATDIRESKYKNTPIDHIDLDGLFVKIDALILQENVYKDPEIRLGNFAEKLSLSGHQLSRILNERFRKNFNEFINEHRIREARTLLETEGDLRIIDVAFQVGFNSLSVFNSQFRRLTGTSPKEFRKRIVRQNG